jgi:hypothetical protein
MKWKINLFYTTSNEYNTERVWKTYLHCTNLTDTYDGAGTLFTDEDGIRHRTTLPFEAVEEVSGV